MQEHPVPRQITTFEFKLIGELTIKQFGYLAFGVALGVILFFLAPNVMLIRILLAAPPILLGVGFAFVPVNDRPMDIWLKNVVKRLMSPTQYFYRKHNDPPKILLGLQLPPREVLLQHIKAQQALNEYQQKKPKNDLREAAKELDTSHESRKRTIQAMMTSSLSTAPAPAPVPAVSEANFTAVTVPQPAPVASATAPVVSPSSVVTAPAEPLPPTAVPPAPAAQSTISLSGVVLTPNGLPLSGMLVYVKKGAETVRLFRTDAQGAFANKLPLSPGEYYLEIEDPQKKHDFARMKISEGMPRMEILATT